MKIFVSWSGETSNRVAILLRNWLPNVLQHVQLFVSSQDISKGERWGLTVGNKLQEHDIGIIALTPENIAAPWIQFEAGALSKSVKNKVIPLLCGMDTIDAPGNPLLQFQWARVERRELHTLVTDINQLSESPLDPGRLDETFSVWIDRFFIEYEKIDFKLKKAQPKNDQDAIKGLEAAVSQMMTEVRNLRSLLGHLPAKVRPNAEVGNFSAPENSQLSDAILRALLSPSSNSLDFWDNGKIRSAAAQKVGLLSEVNPSSRDGEE
jgi:hypothetical protein